MALAAGECIFLYIDSYWEDADGFTSVTVAQAVYVLTDVNVPSAPKFPLPRDVSISAAYANTRSMLLESLRNLSSNLTISSSTSSKATQEQIQSLQVMLIGIYQNLSQQRSFGKQSSNGNDIEAEESEFTRLTLTILINLISNSDIKQDTTLAVEAYSSLPDMNAAEQTKTISVEAVEVSPQRRQLDAIEARWTTVRLALEILGEMVAGIDGLLDPALLGKTEEEYEEWNGIQSENGADDDSKMDEDGEMITEDSTASTAAQAQNDLSISTDIRKLLSNLPSILINLGRSSSISFTSPSLSTSSKNANNNTGKEEESLIPTQIDMQTGSETTSNEVEGLSSPGTYVPAVSEVFSFVHVRALECLNNLLITLARSGLTPGDGKARDANEETEDEGEEDKDDDDETFRSMSPEALIAGGIEEVGDMDSEDNNASEGETFLQDNLKTLQSVFEDLFHSLLDYQNRYHNALSMTGSVAQAKKKEPMLESLELVVEAGVGSIWALSRLCGDLLVSMRPSHEIRL